MKIVTLIYIIILLATTCGAFSYGEALTNKDWFNDPYWKSWHGKFEEMCLNVCPWLWITSPMVIMILLILA